MKSLCLSAAEVRTLLATGKLVQFVVLDEQPPKGVDVRTFQHHFEDGYHHHALTVGQGEDMKFFHCPFAVGERRWIKERWRYDRYCFLPLIYQADCDEADGKLVKWNRASGLSFVRSRLTLAVVAVEAMQRDTEWCFRVAFERVEPDDG